MASENLKSTSGPKNSVLATLLAACAGWAAFMLFCVCMAAISNSWAILFVLGLASAAVIFGVWLMLVVPLAFVSSSSVLWKPNILALIGAAIGPLLVCVNQIYEFRSNSTITIYDPAEYFFADVLFPSIPAAIIGGFIGLMAAKLHAQRRRAKQLPEKA